MEEKEKNKSMLLLCCSVSVGLLQELLIMYCNALCMFRLLLWTRRGAAAADTPPILFVTL